MTPDDLALAHQRGRLEQSCSACGRWEAAGAYCSGCGRPMSAADWYPNGDKTGRAVARQVAPRGAQTPHKAGSEAERGSTDLNDAPDGSRTVAA